jgi:hypothetical protein
MHFQVMVTTQKKFVVTGKTWRTYNDDHQQIEPSSIGVYSIASKSVINIYSKEKHYNLKFHINTNTNTVTGYSMEYMVFSVLSRNIDHQKIMFGPDTTISAIFCSIHICSPDL